jgi:hypothetical protein
MSVDCSNILSYFMRIIWNKTKRKKKSRTKKGHETKRNDTNRNETKKTVFQTLISIFSRVLNLNFLGFLVKIIYPPIFHPSKRRQVRTKTRTMYVYQSVDSVRWKPRRFPRYSNILEFWPQLLFTQLTQVSVERLFSIVTFIFSPLRTRIGGTLLSDIVFLNFLK